MNLVDKQIRRYLKSISDKQIISKTTTSYYYKIKSDEYFMEIRFSDHFGERKTYDMNIIKANNSGFYILNVFGIQIIITEKNALAYIKSLLMIYPEMSLLSKKSKESFNLQEKEILKMKTKIQSTEKKIEKRESRLIEREELCNQIWNEKDEAIRQRDLAIKEKNKINNSLNSLRKKLKELNKIMDDLNNH